MTASSELMVRSGVLIGAPGLVAELGGQPALVEREAGLTRRAMANHDRPIPVSKVARYLLAAAQQCGCNSFGLRLGPRQSLVLFGTLAPLLESAATIGELVHDIAAYFPLHTRGALVSLVPESGGIAVCYDPAAGLAEGQRQLVELGIAVLVTELRRHCPDWVPDTIRMRHSATSERTAYVQILGCVPQFNADRNALFLPRALLDRATLKGDRALHHSLESRFAIARKQQLEAVVTRAEIVVRALLPFAPCDLATTARMMRMSRRSLQRRLSQRGDSYARVLDRVRADLARAYLRDSELNVAQIAELLQFSETSALSRACRRWYGASPRALRRAA